MSHSGHTGVKGELPHPWSNHMWRWREYLNETMGFSIGVGPEDAMWCVDATRNNPDTYAVFCAIERINNESRPHGS